jgi:hypothetical protein
MFRENIALMFILICLLGVLGFVLTCVSVLWRKGLSGFPIWVWGGIAFGACYAAVCLPVFYSSTLEHRLSLESGGYSSAYWLINAPAKCLIYLLAYRGRQHLLDYYLFMPRYVVCVGAVLYVLLGCSLGAWVSVSKKKAQGIDASIHKGQEPAP